MRSEMPIVNISDNSEPSSSKFDQDDIKILENLNLLAQAKKWRKLFLSAKASADRINHSTSAIYQLQAALGLADERKIKLCCVKIQKIVDIDNTTIAATMLLNNERPLEAAKVLAGIPSEQRTGEVANLAKRAVKMTKDRSARRAVSRLLYAAAPPPKTIAEASKHRFPSDSDNYNLPPSRIDVVRLNGVDPEIEDNVKKMVAKFDGVLKREGFPIVTEYKDVFINETGTIWSADGSVLQATARAVPRIKDPSSVPVFDEAYSCLGRHKGYFEWIVRRLSGLAWRLEPSTPDCPILLRKEQAGLAADALGALGISEDALITVDGPVFCRRLYCGHVSIGALARTTAFQPVYGELIAAAERQAGQRTPRRFYISRRDSARRSMVNEADFERALSDRGITPIVLSELGLLEKINLFRDAELVVGAHGAGLSHLVFAKPGVRVVEIMPTTLAKSNMLGVQTCFTRLSVVYGHRHTFVLQPMDPVTSEWSPDIAEIDRVLAAG